MDRPTLRRLEDTVFVLERSIRRLREAALPYSDCVTAQLQFEYVLNMAQIYEIPAADRTAGRQLLPTPGRSCPAAATVSSGFCAFYCGLPA